MSPRCVASLCCYIVPSLANLSCNSALMYPTHHCRRTRAILVNNPSNPCGSVYSEAHLRAIVAVAEKVWRLLSYLSQLG